MEILDTHDPSGWDCGLRHSCASACRQARDCSRHRPGPAPGWRIRWCRDTRSRPSMR